MIRALNATVAEVKEDGTVLNIANLFGTSGDSKPTEGYANGTVFLEVDTGKIYLFNEETSTWVEMQ